MDSFKLPVIFFFSRRDKKKNTKVFIKRLGSLFGVFLTIIAFLLIGAHFATLSINSYKGDSSRFTQATIDNNFEAQYNTANMSDPSNSYKFDSKIKVLTWGDIAQQDLYDVYNEAKVPSSGINITKLERYVVPLLTVRDKNEGPESRKVAFFQDCKNFNRS